MDKKTLITQLGAGIAGMIFHYAIAFILKLDADWIWAFYLFFMSVSLYISYYCTITYRKNPERVGLIFMVMIVAKMLLFSLAFSPLLFAEIAITMNQKVNMVVPFVVFLLLEVFAVFKLLSSDKSVG